VRRMRPLPTFSVGVRPWPLSGRRIWAPFFEPQDIKSQALGAIWRFSKTAGLPWKTVGA
jgi:hypothetical protein